MVPLLAKVGASASWSKSFFQPREGFDFALPSLFAFLTCEPNDVVGSIHMKAMPVILTEPDEVETWLTAPWSDASKLQRPLPQGALQIVSVGRKEDGRPEFMPAGETLF